MSYIPDERVRLERVELELLRRFGDLPAGVVHEEVQVSIRAFDGARVRTYVPVLVHKRAREALRRATRHAPAR